MNKKFLITGLVTGIAAFFTGWLIWGIILMKFSEANTTVYPGLVKEEMNFPAILLGNITWGYTLTWIYSRFEGKKSWSGGAIMGVIIGALYALGLNLSYYAFWNLYTPVLQVVDILANAVYSGILGAIVGLMLKTRE
jgi:hypothetical protein